MQYAVILERTRDGYSARVPDLSGCYSDGATLEEAKANIREAISGHLAILRDNGDPIPPPSTVVEVVDAA